MSRFHHVLVIQTLFSEAENEGILLWLESGWAIDARLGRVTRTHEDIDVAYIKDKEAAYLELTRSLGFGRHEETDYGFLCQRDGVLLDSEPCFEADGQYNFPGFPKGSCPLEREGVVRGYRIRCLSWEAMYFEFLGYLREVPTKQWRDKDFESLRIIEAHLSEETRQALESLHTSTA